jgi:SOS-response transcriptional repressor LexA
MMGLTKRQSEALAFIRGFIEAKGYSPSTVEIMQGLGLASKSGVNRLVHGLRERGAVDFLDYRQRSIVLTERAAA